MTWRCTTARRSFLVKTRLNNEYSHGGETIVIPHTLLITAMTVVDDVTKSITMDVKQPGDAVIVVGHHQA